MEPTLADLMETLSDHDADELNRVHAHLRDLWMHPDAFAVGDMVERWRNDPTLMCVELGVIFGIEYEKAYPTGQSDEWPIPLGERPSGGDDA